MHVHPQGEEKNGGGVIYRKKLEVHLQVEQESICLLGGGDFKGGSG